MDIVTKIEEQNMRSLNISIISFDIEYVLLVENWGKFRITCTHFNVLNRIRHGAENGWGGGGLSLKLQVFVFAKSIDDLFHELITRQPECHINY